MGIAWLSSVRVLRYEIKFSKRTQPTSTYQAFVDILRKPTAHVSWEEQKTF